MEVENRIVFFFFLKLGESDGGRWLSCSYIRQKQEVLVCRCPVLRSWVMIMYCEFQNAERMGFENFHHFYHKI